MNINLGSINEPSILCNVEVIQHLPVVFERKCGTGEDMNGIKKNGSGKETNPH